ncbi:nonsense-mediated mRNA decay factor SMG7-like isoform X3 [Physella acuta]|uniref:nonsense-mediated mRNA decay factor SMG7-like isoform X3 n=1 Tax=Physella acuta TaxID=109671 RepID=UPI0027DC4391|nr:nonsense-mediated mRNA decay factor SMG7-like isoform X3 [Physella acuta]
MSSAAAQIMRQADAVKNTMTESGKAFADLWVTRQKLEDLYKKMLLLDLEYALDKKVEQELWNHAFKNQINTLQTQAKDRQNPKKVEAQASLNLFLETASGFYLQFLQMICSTFKLDLPFRRKSAAFGIMRENTMNYKSIVTPKKSSCLYICCHCLVHLGDIARYRQQTEQAQTYYRHAANLSPNNGQPYNQLAILEASRGDKLSTVFYYIRSLAVRHPFPVAATNLEKFYSKLIKDTRSDFDGLNLTMSELITAFMHFQALLHMSTDLERASNLKMKIVSGLGSHIRSQTVSAAHLTGIVAISIFALHRARCDSNDAGDAVRKTVLSSEEEKIIQIHLSFAAKLLETMLQHTPKEDNKARDFPTLSAIKVLFDWFYLNKDIFHGKDFNNTSIWSDLCKLLNTLQWLLNDSNKASELRKFEDTPLPEDTDLRCFQPLEPTYSAYNFNKAMNEDLSSACERDLRCQRLISHGKWVAQDLPKLKLIVYQPAKSIRTQFSTQKVYHMTESQPTPVQKPSQRQNVAMQTIMKKQMQKRMEQEKSSSSTSPLSVISEEGRFVPPAENGTDPGLSQKTGGRQAGVITLHHKSGGTQKNLPPRLSAKVSNTQNSTLSPRLQKKQSTPNHSSSRSIPAVSRSNTQEGVEGNKEDVQESTGYSSQEVYPSLSMDNYPVLTSARSNASLIPSDNNQQSNKNFLSSTSWGVLNLGRDSGGGMGSAGSPLGMGSSGSPLGMGSKPSSVDNMSGSPRSPQASPGVGSPYSNHDQGMRSSMELPMMGGEAMDNQGRLNFSSSKLNADFLSAIMSASQMVQQQQQQQQQYHHQQQHPSMRQSGEQFQRPPFGQGHLNPMLNQPPAQSNNYYQPQNPMQNMFQQPPLNQGTTGSNLPGQNSAILNQAQSSRGMNMLGNQSMKMQTPLSSMNMPPPQRGMAQGPQSMMLDSRAQTTSTASPARGYQASRMDSSQSFMGNQAASPAPVGFIPPSAVVAQTKGQAPSLNGPSYPSSMMSGGSVGTGRSGNNVSQSLSGMGGAPFMGGQHLHHHPQQVSAMKSQSSGLLYQNIPLPGSATGGSSAGSGGPSSNMSGMVMPGQAQGQFSGQPMSHIQHSAYNNSGQASNSLLQDSRLSASFQGHAAGTPKPEKQNIPTQFIPQQQQQVHKQGPGTQQAMIRAVMDPPFLQASGEYTLFSNNNSPAWPTSLVKNTNQMLKAASSKGHGPNAQMASAQMMAGQGHQDPGTNMQGLWSSTGPSPLERLLEQQRNQRQADG